MVQWRRRIFPVGAYLTGATHIQLKFFASDSVLTTWDGNGQSTTVGGLDDFTIYSKQEISSVATTAATKSAIYPNPADETVNIVLGAAAEGQISCYDLLGQKITEITTTPANTHYTVDTKGLAPGAYYVTIQTGSSIQSKKIVVAHK